MKKQIFLTITASIILGISACEKPFEYQTSEIPTFKALEKPANGKGYQVHLPAFPIPANFEREIFVRMPLNNPQEIYVNGFEAKMREGTHHLILYGFEDENDPFLPKIGRIREQNMQDGRINIWANMAESAWYFEAPTAEYKFSMPEGYAVKMPANISFDLNSHYFNKTDATRFGEIYANIYTTPKEKVTQIVENEIYAWNEEITLPPNKKTVIEHDYTFKKDTYFLTMTSHTHSRGEKFEIKYVGGENDGKTIYVSEDYLHPVVLKFPKPFLFKKGEGFKTVVTFNNKTNRTIKAGVTSEDEMLMVFGYAFQK